MLTHVYLDPRRRHAMREPARSIWVKRFSNLYPIHIGSLILAIARAKLVALLAIPPADAAAMARFVLDNINRPELFPGEARHIMGNGEPVINLLLKFGTLQASDPYYLTFNPPPWSMSALFFFYLLFPFAAPRLLRTKRFLPALAITALVYIVPALLVIAFSHFGTPETGILHRNPIVRLPEFIAGILLCTGFMRSAVTPNG